MDDLSDTNNSHEPTLQLILQMLPTQQAEAQPHYLQVKVDNAVIQQSLAEVNRKVCILSADLVELQQQKAEGEEAIEMKACPAAPVTVGGLKIFAQPDLFMATMDKQWRLCQLIDPLKAVAAQVFLQKPARLKIIHNGHVSMCTSEQEAMMALSNFKTAVSML
ncbi:hypothetical protein NDU88_002698 [Pleurodeles waltl]|uniref:Uncharacterized protein n=1 Tax=Pleurodeles waltl TaxID=8319 RepID=A0AAV7KZQ3_PLEWA|nr:hypothetical protein NDU88_002698 [Pleurodeles waltl]